LYGIGSDVLFERSSTDIFTKAVLETDASVARVMPVYTVVHKNVPVDIRS